MGHRIVYIIFIVICFCIKFKNAIRVYEERLKCFQCLSEATDPKPLCDTDYWKLSNATEKLNMQITCPIAHSSFCVKKIEKIDSGYRTQRGCAASTDDYQQHLRVGCITTKADVDTLLCICRGHFCNRESKPTMAHFMYYFIIFVYFIHVR